MLVVPEQLVCGSRIWENLRPRKGDYCTNVVDKITGICMYT